MKKQLLICIQAALLGAALSACNAGSTQSSATTQNSTTTQNSANSNKQVATAKQANSAQYQYNYSLEQTILKAFPASYNSNNCIYTGSNGGCNAFGVLAESVLLPTEPGTYTAKSSDISDLNYSNASIDEEGSFTQTTDCNNVTDINQTCTTSSYSKEITNSTTSTLTNGWNLGGEYGLSMTASIAVGGKIPLSPSASTTTEWKINGEYNSSLENSTTTSETVTYSANEQTINVPPHTHYQIVTRFSMVEVDDDFPVTMEVSGKAPLNTYENQRSSGGINSGLFFPKQGSVDAYTELATSMTELPIGISLNQQNKTILLDGTVHVKGITGTNYTVDIYNVTPTANNNANGQGKILLKSYQIATDKKLISRKTSGASPTMLTSTNEIQSSSNSSSDSRYAFWYNIGKLGDVILEPGSSTSAQAIFTDADEVSKSHGVYGYKLIMQNDGMLMLYAITSQVNGKANFTTGTEPEHPIWAAGNKIYGPDLKPIMLFDQKECKLEVYDISSTYDVYDGKKKWGPCSLILQGDGNLVIYDANNEARWASNTSYHF